MERLIHWYKTRHTEIPAHFDNSPLNPESRFSLQILEQNILIPVEQEFGKVVVTYGFTSLSLKNYLIRHFPGQMAPALDQHAASELNSKGNLLLSDKNAFLTQFTFTKIPLVPFRQRLRHLSFPLQMH